MTLLADPGGDHPTHAVQLLHALAPRRTTLAQHHLADLGTKDKILDPLLDLQLF